jgi:NhaP-type Na+/H+ or K+/H+ antiporter
MNSGIAIFFLIVVVYAIFAVWLGKRSITMPMFFLVVGALVGPFGLSLMDFSVNSETVKFLVEITLAVILFSDASSLKLSELRDDPGVPLRLLGVALPMIIFLGGLIAFLIFPQEELGFALLIGAILAPTDAALGLPIFSNKRVPVRIRRALNVESGLNDGIATPFVTLFTSLAVAEISQKLSGWATTALLDILIAVAIGAALGLAGGWLFSMALHARLTSQATEQVGTIALVLAIYSVSVILGGNGFIAAFIGGLFFGYITQHKLHHALGLTEGVGTLLSVFAWAIFGALLVIPLFTSFTIMAFIYAILSLTLIRMVPVAISLLGLHFRLDTTLMMGWLGPRGLASVVFTLIAFESFHEAGRAYDILFAIAGWTIFLSVLLHGFSALPLAHWYSNRLKTAPADTPEFKEMRELEGQRSGLHPINQPLDQAAENGVDIRQ